MELTTEDVERLIMICKEQGVSYFRLDKLAFGWAPAEEEAEEDEDDDSSPPVSGFSHTVEVSDRPTDYMSVFGGRLPLFQTVTNPSTPGG
jgi:hypothetical protein